MSKGEETRNAILDRALTLARTVGLEGLSIGRLAEDLHLSKSGLFAHFKSKEALELQVIRVAREAFVAGVMAPALKAPRGEPRVRALFERWIEWGMQEGGCVFVALSVELDDRPGPARDAVKAGQRDWFDALTTATAIAVREKHFRKDVDPEQFAFEMYSLMFGLHHFQRILDDPEALARTRRAFESLIEKSR